MYVKYEYVYYLSRVLHVSDSYLIHMYVYVCPIYRLIFFATKPDKKKTIIFIEIYSETIEF